MSIYKHNPSILLGNEVDKKFCTGSDELCDYIDFLEKYANRLMDFKVRHLQGVRFKWHIIKAIAIGHWSELR